MKKLKFLFLSSVLLSTGLFAQYSTDWIRPGDNYQKTGTMLARDNADNVAVTGFWIANNIYTRKYDKFGNLQWENTSTSGVAQRYEMSYWINCDSSNNVIVTGCRYSYGQFNYPDALVVLKYDPAGNLLWKNTIPMTFFVNSLYSFNVRSEVDINGNIYVGTVATAPSGFVLVKIDAAGNILYTNSDNTNPVGTFRSMRLAGSQIVMSGGTPVTNNANAICWSTSGTVTWNTVHSGNYGVDIEMDETGNTYLLTSLDNQVSGSSGEDIKIYKLNSSGAQIWVNNYDFTGYEFPVRFTYLAGKISVTGYGNIASSYFDWITFQTNTSGSMLWNTRYNETAVNDELPYFIAAKANGDVFITGWGGPVYNQLGNSYLRMITTKYDNTGLRKWVDSVNIYSGRGVGCAIASDNSLFVLSYANTTAFHFLDHDGSAAAAVPVGLLVSNVTNSSALFNWSPVSGANLYHLRYKLSAASAWTIVSTNQTSVNITGLLPNSTYDYACEAVNSGGPSGYTATQTFTTASFPLAVTGITLNARREGQHVLVNWSTLAEQNSAWFDVERSMDGVDFSSIGRVPAAGNSSEARHYRFVDMNVTGSMLFYRLKMVDADAGYKLSPVRVVPKSGVNKQEFLVYPNPARSFINLVLNEALTESIQVQIINPMGQTVKLAGILPGTQLTRFDVRELPKGMYLIKLSGKQFQQAIKFLKE